MTIWVEKVKYLISKPEELIKMKTNAIAFVAEQYAKNVIDKKWKLVYNQIIKNE